MRRWWLAPVCAFLAACGGAPGPPAPQPAPAAQPKPVDETRRFPLADRVGIELMEGKLLGKDFLPGGNLAQYRRKGKTYQQFLIHAKSPEAAALLLFDFNTHLRDSKYLAHMGGYFGMDGEKPVYIFQKGVFLAGFIGLPEKEADPLARQFAARLN